MSPRLLLHPYRLPLHRPWRSAHGGLSERQGWLVIAHGGQHESRHRGYGDCAPFPAAGTETLAAAAARLKYWQMRAQSESDQELLDALSNSLPSQTPAADAAVEIALLDWHARTARQCLRALLQPGAAELEQIPVNAALGTLIDCTPAALHAAARRDFWVFKLKVGTAPIETELAHLRSLLAALPQPGQLRLDANGAWDLATARRFLAALEQLPQQADSNLPVIESLEEPLREPRDADLAHLQALTSIPLALDESLPRRPWPPPAAPLPVRRVILKPGVLGGLRPSLALAKAALEAGAQPLVTSLIDSAAGLWAAAELAAAISALAQQTPGGIPSAGLCHGLATAEWLAADLGRSPPLCAGQLRLSTLPGSGFQPFNQHNPAPIS
ncbi:enolase C-terminal domain-like protein [Thiorhodovibrio frisius]|uniref:Enolase superfamily enzyme related to L-alanine-DL-glutamate epimerase n=1 Tax=Thiorhodovibrio frisius TaxID=631362 RepID=H8YWU8_9GAMM|nr:enolase C-terminal domain-like protein [Thiorhodovibrio frisius]EIC22924.1 enolase superfamily enzyme related to L-alanine-DL-glutamate epimerase [Thiorhodovibrio frisius]WPL22817.1 L-Ala-D/L-Glu epimerase [Thiorhodovibrio frisius]